MAVVQMPFVNSVPSLSEEGTTPGSYLCSMPSLAYSNACSAALLHSWKMPAYPAAPETQQQQQQQEQQQASASPEEAAQASFSATCTTQDLQRHTVQVPDGATLRLNLDDPVQRGYLEAYGAELVDKGQNTTSFFTLTAARHAGLQEATEQLHRMFLRATEHAIYNDALLRDEFLIPKALWSRVRASWEAQREDVVSGRFDFALTDTGVKVYEYNADSASCLVECGTMCDKWAKAAGIGHVGSSSGSMLFSNLVQTWAARKVDGVLHMLHDADPEERIHTLYMKSAAEQAGVRCKVYDSVASFSWTASGDIQDEDGDVVRNIWKTWNWQTILDQLKDTDAGAAPAEQAGSCAAAPAPRLADILLSQQVRVFEPLWTLLPACKAILPLLWELYPNHPLLLNSAFELTPELVQTGYASKPVTGRGGNNVILYNTGGTLIEEAPGRWAEDKLVYQELCHMPKYNGKNVQVCCWSVNGMYAGTVLRWGESNIIRFENSLPALRVI